MIAAGKPGRYLFFVGEEVGGIGSSAFVKDNPDFKADMVVSFDRRGTSDVITHQGGYETASPLFGSALAAALNSTDVRFDYKACDGGVYTDSKEFAGIVPECTNISVGYYHEHTTREYQDLNHLLALRDACIKLDWHALPIDRDPAEDPWSSWMKQYENYNVDVPFTTRGQARDAIEAIKHAVALDQLDANTLFYQLNIIEEYLS